MSAPHTVRHPSRHLARPLLVCVGAGVLALVPSAAQADPGTPVPLGAAASFAVLAGAGVTNTGASTLGGDIGSFATTSISGLGTITLVGGVNHAGDAVTQQAKTDLVTAYGNASGQTPDPLGGVELAGLTLEPGVYDTGGEIELNGNLTLDANGDPAAVFIFQSLSTLLAGPGSSVTFIDGATACNVYWRVPTSATILAGSRFAGTILAEASISFEAGASLEGRALAQTGEVTLITTTITRPACANGSGGTPSTGPSTGPGTDTGTGTGTGAGPATAADAAAAGRNQVAVRPRGGVATGDGSSLPQRGADPAALAVGGAFLVAGVVMAVVSVSRRRHPRPAPLG